MNIKEERLTIKSGINGPNIKKGIIEEITKDFIFTFFGALSNFFCIEITLN